VEDSSVYFAVECTRCEELIPLVEVASGPNVASWGLPRVRPFEVMCLQCGRTREYKYRHLVLITGPPPPPDFVVHPAFKNIHP
jgi:hypothetical protein